MVESLTGYIVRLAEEHCVLAGVLYWKEIRTLAAKGNIFTFRVTNDAGYSTHTINGCGSPAADFVRALEILTGRRDLSCLTLLTWRRVLPGHSLLRRCRAWCESCMYAWREANQPIYEPLLWTLQAVTVCPYAHYGPALITLISKKDVQPCEKSVDRCDTNFDRICLYLNRLPTEFRVLCVRDATLRLPAIRVEEEDARRRIGPFGHQVY